MKKLIVPIFSMRSYDDNGYTVLKDGNFQLHLHRASDEDIIVVPRNIVDEAELVKLFPNKKFVTMEYGINALATREKFWSELNLEIVYSLFHSNNCDVLVTDITGYSGKLPVIFNFNITSDPENPRDYIDKFLGHDVLSVNKSIRTYVLNRGQKEVLIANGANPSKIIVCQRVINPYILESYVRDLDPLYLGHNTIFFPFRISDKCYKFDLVVNESMKKYGGAVFITDPNDSFDREKYSDLAIIHRMKLSKVDFYRVLLGQPKIVYHENPEKVFHPGLAELIYFNANIICEYNLPNICDLIINPGEDTWQKLF